MNKYKSLTYLKELIMDGGEPAKLTIGVTYPIIAETDHGGDEGYTVSIEDDEGKDHSFGLETEWDDCVYKYFRIKLNGVGEFYPGDVVCENLQVGVVVDGTESLGNMSIYFKEDETTMVIGNPKDVMLIKGGTMRRWKLEPEQ